MGKSFNHKNRSYNGLKMPRATDKKDRHTVRFPEYTDDGTRRPSEAKYFEPRETRIKNARIKEMSHPQAKRVLRRDERHKLREQLDEYEGDLN